jgi:hypothetical protein
LLVERFAESVAARDFVLAWIDVYAFAHVFGAPKMFHQTSCQAA